MLVGAFALHYLMQSHGYCTLPGSWRGRTKVFSRLRPLLAELEHQESPAVSVLYRS